MKDPLKNMGRTIAGPSWYLSDAFKTNSFRERECTTGKCYDLSLRCVATLEITNLSNGIDYISLRGGSFLDSIKYIKQYPMYSFYKTHFHDFGFRCGRTE